LIAGSAARVTASSLWHAIGGQLRNPSGFAGRVIGLMMRIVNIEPNKLAVASLLIEPTDTVLELGFGPGHAVQLMVREAFAGRVLGIDHSPIMVEQAGNRNRAAIHDGRVVLYQAPFTRLPFGDSVIDKILAVNVIYFWQDVPAVIKEMCRVLRPGGRVSIYATDKSTMHRWKFAGPQTHHLFDAAELSAALQQMGSDLDRILVRKVRLFGRVQGLLVTFTSPLLTRKLTRRVPA
jgi:ubiquinone/menaquinone biosynthesis C-methylase UbiE